MYGHVEAIVVGPLLCLCMAIPSHTAAVVHHQVSTPPMIVLWASPFGDDTADGATASTPMRTLHAVRDRIRSRRNISTDEDGCEVAEAIVNLMGGSFQLNATLNLTISDSCTTWRGLNSTVPAAVISGGGAQINWSTPGTDGIRTAVLSEEQHKAAATAGSVFPQLFVGDHRSPVSRAPAQFLTNTTSYFEWTSANGGPSVAAFGYNSSRVNPDTWVPSDDPDAVQDISVGIFDAPWSMQRRRVESFDASSKSVNVSLPYLSKPLSDASFVGIKRWGALNIQTGPLPPGSFRYRTVTRTISFNGTVSSAVVPTLLTLIRISDRANSIKFSNTAFKFTATGQNPSNYSYGPAMDGAIEVENATSIRFSSCVFAHLGANGLQLRHNVSDVSVSGSIFSDIGSRGFTTTLERTSASQDASNLVIADSVFSGCGKIFMQQPYCIFVSGAKNISVVHNDVSNVPYSGIRVWGHFITDSKATEDFDAGYAGVFSIVGNHVHDVGLGLLSDFGGIFVTTIPGGAGGGDCVESYGTESCNVLAIVDGNVVHSVRHHDHGGAGIYTDESSGRTNITNNLVFNNSGWGVHLHCGMAHAVVNNIFSGNAALPPAPFGPYETRDYSFEPYCNFEAHPKTVQGVILERNIFDQAVGPSVGIGRAVALFNNNTVGKSGYGNASHVKENTIIDNNVYSCRDGHGCVDDFPGDSTAGRSLASWRAWSGKDANSIGGSPGFGQNPETTLAIRKDFRVDLSRSPAVATIGFKPLNGLASVGPRPSNLVIATCSNNGGDSGVWWNGCIVNV